MRSPLEFLAQASPVRLAFRAAVFAVLVLLASFAIDVANYKVGPMQSERGYAHAVSWTWGFIIVVPTILLLFISSLQAVVAAIPELNRRQMLESGAGRRPRNLDAVVQAMWVDTLRNSRTVSWLLAVLAFSECLVEWWVTSGGPLLIGMNPAENELDWSVKFINAGPLRAGANATFSLIVFLMQGVLVTVILQFGLFLYCCYVWLEKLSDAQSAIRLAAQVPSQLTPVGGQVDRRYGFQVFEEWMGYLLLTAASTYVVLYLSRLWNAFLHDPAGPASLWDYLKGWWQTKQVNPAQATQTVFQSLPELDFSSTFVTVCAGLGLLAITGLVAFVYRRTVTRARDVAVGIVTEKRGKNARHDIEELSKIQTWPGGYPAKSFFILYGVFAFASMFFIAGGIVLISLYLVAVSAKVLAQVRKA